MTKAQNANEWAMAKVRTDGGDLYRLDITFKNGKTGSETYCLSDAESIKRDIEFNGGKAEITQIRWGK